MEIDCGLHRLITERGTLWEFGLCANRYFVCSGKALPSHGEPVDKLLRISDYEENSGAFFDWRMRLLATTFLHPVTYLHYECEATRDAALNIQLEITKILTEGQRFSLPESALK